MKIIWSRQNKRDNKRRDVPVKGDQPAATAKGSALGTEEKKEEEHFVYTVVPEQITLGPKMGIMVEFRAFSKDIGKITEQWAC